MRKLTIIFLMAISFFLRVASQDGPGSFKDPSKEFTVMPFWFWNDSLTDKKIVDQISDFESHGVYGFAIHPRIGLPENIKWLSPEMIHFMRIAIEEASRRNMYVILYDEGMYPSGSSSGQVVERNPKHAARGLVKIDLNPEEDLRIPEGARLITVNKRADGRKVAILEKYTGGVIRGLHYIGEGTSGMREESPPAGDILNPDAVKSFINLVYEKYASEFGSFFGTTVIGIFTDEPSPLGRGSGRGIIPGNSALLPAIEKITGYDLKPYLSDLWYSDNPDFQKHRNDYYHAINKCLEDIYYKQLSDWCASHRIALMGHPAASMDIGTEKYFQIPGQDLVWRYVEPGEKALNGEHSTMAKCASSAMLHLGYRRNSNELYGAYGHNLNWDEMLWLANWCFIRGQNLMIPHAFYYSVRGPRLEERPPDVGPNAIWWDKYKYYADACRRLSWINTDSKPVCSVAILSDATFLPQRAAKILYQSQIDFNYLEIEYLLENAKISEAGLSLGGMNYKVLILDSLTTLPGKALPVLEKFIASGNVIISCNPIYSKLLPASVRSDRDERMADKIKTVTGSGFSLSSPSKSIRFRHVLKDNDHYLMFFNEEKTPVSTRLTVNIKGRRYEWLNQFDGTSEKATGITKGDKELILNPFEMKIIRITGK